MQTYLFYDIETTGLNKAFDQLLQFAAIRTDLNLYEIERYELKIKLNPDVIPSPRAVVTHRIGIQEAQQGISELDAIQQIHQWMNTPGTISLGYNTLGFDDEFLRFAFYRHLLTPYTHQYANLCGRMDIYPIAIMYYLFKNSVIQWPRLKDKLSLKLEEINYLNQFVTGRSHQAMVDVEATIALAKCFYADTDMWKFLQGYFNKQQDQQRSLQHSKEPCLLIDGFIGSMNAYQCPVLFLGYHKHYTNQSMWLRLDSKELSQLNLATIKETTRVTLKKMGEPGFILPLKDRYLQHLHPDRIVLAQENAARLKANTEFFSKLIEYHANNLYLTHPRVDEQANLYLKGFWTEAENQFCRRFHTANPTEKAELTERTNHPRIKELATRLIGKYYPEELTPTQKATFNTHLQQLHSEEQPQWTDHRGEKRMTVNTALADIDALFNERTNMEELRLLQDLRHYLQNRFRQ